MQSDKTCLLVEQYLGYLTTIKGRSNNTIFEYRTDILSFFKYVSVLYRIQIRKFVFHQIDYPIHMLFDLKLFYINFIRCLLPEILAVTL